MAAVPPPTPPTTPLTPIRGGANPFILTAGALAMAAGIGMTIDTFNGRREEVQRKVDAMKEHAEMKNWEAGVAHWSGFPWMDQLTHKVKTYLLFGPGGLKVKWEEFKIRFNNVVEVLSINALPLGLGAGSMYAGLGPAKVNRVVKDGVSTVVKSGIIDAVFDSSRKLLGAVARPLGKGLLKLAHLAVKSPQNLAITLGATLFAGFFLKRFDASYGHDGQHDFFRDDIFINHGH